MTDANGSPPGPPTPHPSSSRRVRPRVLAGLAVVAALTGAALVVVGVRGSSDTTAVDTVTLDVESAVAPVPSTVAPVVTPPPTTPVSDSADEQSTVEPEPALSPLADLLGEQYSAVPEEIQPRPRPVSMEIDVIDVSRYPIRAVGLEPDGELEVPDETEIGWYRYGATAGRPGATVLAAHVSWNRTVGPFGRLGTLEPGNRVSVTLDDGTTRRYEVFERAIYGKSELPRDRIWRNTGPETLVLITCGGEFNPDIRRYKENVVVYAAPVG